MVPLLFGHRTCPIYKVQSLSEIGKYKCFKDVVFVNYFPIRKLLRVFLQLRALERRHAATAGHAAPVGQVHVRCIHSSSECNNSHIIYPSYPYFSFQNCNVCAIVISQKPLQNGGIYAKNKKSGTPVIRTISDSSGGRLHSARRQEPLRH